MESKARAERDKIAALSQAEVDRIQNESAAQDKRVDAAATDEYERVVQQHMSERMLQRQKIEALRALSTSSNAKVILLGGDAKNPTTLDLK
jgi:regulator of protease activity HflC (stomatin/prohibitin superfamily)